MEKLKDWKRLASVEDFFPNITFYRVIAIDFPAGRKVEGHNTKNKLKEILLNCVQR